MIDFIKNIFRPKLEPLNYITINSSNIANNICVLKNLQKSSKIFPVLKANAYGHWLKEICSILNKSDIEIVCVDSFIEYQFIKKYTVKKVLVLWETNKENYLFYDFGRTYFCIYNIDTISYLASLNKKIKIHLFLNTWMNREWIREKDINNALWVIKNSKLILDWVCSHFSSLDDLSFVNSQKQIDIFKKIYRIIESSWFNPRYKHIWASSWVLKLKDDFFNAFRPWLSFYWYNPLQKEDDSFSLGANLKPALDLYCKIVSINEVLKWEWVSYNLSYKFPKDTRIATIAFWYHEWLDRRFSNNLKIKYNWLYYPIRWRICMNLCSFEIWDDDLKIWDIVQLISSGNKDLNSVCNLANQIWTIEYEILVWLDKTIRRKVL